MKKSLFAIMILLACSATVMAQGFQRRTVEERVQRVHEKLDSAFKLDKAKMTQVDSVFASYYRAQDKLRDELMSGGNRPDPQTMREKFQPITDDRDKQLKPLLGDDNFKKFKDEIEPSMRRGGGRPQQ